MSLEHAVEQAIDILKTGESDECKRAWSLLATAAAVDASETETVTRGTHVQSVDLGLLAERIKKGCEKYPEGCTALSLFDESGEVAHAINKREPIERVRAELLDVAVVAMRLYFGEVDEDSVLKGLLQLGAKCRRCRSFVEHGNTLCTWCADSEGP